METLYDHINCSSVFDLLVFLAQFVIRGQINLKMNMANKKTKIRDNNATIIRLVCRLDR